MAPHAEPEAVTDTSSVVYDDPVLSNGDTHPVFTLDSVLPHRQKSKPPATGVAAFSEADMFKSKRALLSKRPKAKRWDHRLSEESKARTASSLKAAMKYFKPDTISLCGGLPSSDYFPFEQLSAKVPIPPHFSEHETASTGQPFSTGKHDAREGKSHLDLSIALNYGQAMGPAALVRFLTEHTEIVHDPPYADWDVCLTAGSTSALEIAVRMFAEKGHYVITEEYTFSSAIETVAPLGCRMLGIKMDGDGMLPDDLDHVLSTWDETARNAPKPFLVYTVPTGQNPTASTQPLERRKQLYAVAEKHDLFILEDEPYFFLQMDPFVSGVVHEVPQPFAPQVPVAQFLKQLVPSYLSLDTSGRVLRLDSFSKIIAPGSRTGWVTGSKQVIERFIRHSEVSVQNPAGFAMVHLYNLLERNWGHAGFLEWLMFIRAEYTRRRDIIINACETHLPREICSWQPPMAGMFHWVKVDVSKHPLYASRRLPDGSVSYDTLLEIEEAMFLAAAAQSVLIARGSWFRAERGSDTELFFRTTFAAAPADKMTEAIRRVGEAIRKEFGVQSAEGDVRVEKQNGHAA